MTTTLERKCQGCGGMTEDWVAINTGYECMDCFRKTHPFEWRVMRNMEADRAERKAKVAT